MTATTPPDEPTFSSVVDLGFGCQMLARLDKPRDAHTDAEWEQVVAQCRAAYDEMAKVQSIQPAQPAIELHPDIKAFMDRQRGTDG